MIRYAISDPSLLDRQHPQPYFDMIADRVDFFLYRDKENFNYMYDAKRVIETARRYPFQKVLLHRDIWLVPNLQADGVHLASNQLSDISKAKSMGIFVLYSAHSLQEASKAATLGADMVTLSPIYETPDKGEPLGVEALQEVCRQLSIPVIALGGITDQVKIEEVAEAGAKGFASIRYFVGV